MLKILFILGTRPEVIKLAPLIKHFRNAGKNVFETAVCTTGQHREMLVQTLDFFKIEENFKLDIMREAQTLFGISTSALGKFETVFDQFSPDLVFVQGDTTTTFIGALAAFYKKCPVAHVEAGLRSGNNYSPYPEEVNRRMTSGIAALHFAPTADAQMNLHKENIVDNVHVVGNTVIDALQYACEAIQSPSYDYMRAKYAYLQDNRRLVLVTGHRRESFGEGFLNICKALSLLATRNPDIDFLYPVHLNPEVQRPVYATLAELKNIHLIAPVNYPEMVWLMKRCFIVLTDSGGIQEEAPAFGKPVLVMRGVTERMEGVRAGTARLIGTKVDSIVNEVQVLLDSPEKYALMANAVNPYGDGTTSEQIFQHTLRFFDLSAL